MMGCDKCAALSVPAILERCAACLSLALLALSTAQKAPLYFVTEEWGNYHNNSEVCSERLWSLDRVTMCYYCKEKRQPDFFAT